MKPFAAPPIVFLLFLMSAIASAGAAVSGISAGALGAGHPPLLTRVAAAHAACARGRVTRGGGCVSGRVVTPVLQPRSAPCPGEMMRDAGGRCPAPRSCPSGRRPDREGRCAPIELCSGGRAPDAFGRCPARTCPGGGRPDSLGECPAQSCPTGLTRDTAGRCLPHPLCPDGRQTNAAGICEPLVLCPNGFAPLGGRCAQGATLGDSLSPTSRPVAAHSAATPAGTPKLMPPVKSSTPGPVAAPKLDTPQRQMFRHGATLRTPPMTPPLLTPRHSLQAPTPRFVAPVTLSRPAAPRFAFPSARPAAVATPHFAPPVVGAPHIAPPGTPLH